MSRAGDEGFVDFVMSASPLLLRHAWGLCGDQPTAEELVQDALVRVYPRWASVRDGSPAAYVRRILVNLNANRMRSLARESTTTTGVLPESAATSTVVDDRDHVTRLLRQLPPRERQVVLLRHYVGLGEQEVSDLLGVSVGTVKASGSRGISRLRFTSEGLEQTT